MAIRAGESWGGAEGVAAAKWTQPRHCWSRQALESWFHIGKTWDVVADRPRGHVLLS